MIDLSHLKNYRENNRIEAKKALGGFPRSIWETYSAFANTIGGIILLGVEEAPDKSLHAVDLSAPEKLVSQFWETVSDPDKVSVNILTHDDVRIEEADGKHILVVNVPRAQRTDRPVYIGGDPLTGTYRRNGEGDYRCTAEEVRSMLRDASVQPQDSRVLEYLSFDAFDRESISQYRKQLSANRPDHAWNSLKDADFLGKLGAVSRGSDRTLHPTVAGLLMFGIPQAIRREFPRFSLLYRKSDCCETMGENLYEFFLEIDRILVNLVPADFIRPSSQDRSAFGSALREALTNCIVNADYKGQFGILVESDPCRIVFSNAGSFRLDLAAAMSGGVSDPRNIALNKMFHLIKIGEGTGSGIPRLFSLWRSLGFASPSIAERFDPERTVLTLPLIPSASDGKSSVFDSLPLRVENAILKEKIIRILTDKVSAEETELAALLREDPKKICNLLLELSREGLIVSELKSDRLRYRLKS